MKNIVYVFKHMYLMRILFSCDLYNLQATIIGNIINLALSTWLYQPGFTDHSTAQLQLTVLLGGAGGGPPSH